MNKIQQAQEKPVSAGYFNKDAYKKEAQMVLVMKTGVAGLRYQVDGESDEGRDLLEHLTPGTELLLYREPENEYDEWAVSVYTKEDKQIGYVTRFKNEMMARLMDYGKKFFAYVG